MLNALYKFNHYTHTMLARKTIHRVKTPRFYCQFAQKKKDLVSHIGKADTLFNLKKILYCYADGKNISLEAEKQLIIEKLEQAKTFDDLMGVIKTERDSFENRHPEFTKDELIFARFIYGCGVCLIIWIIYEILFYRNWKPSCDDY